MRGLNPGQKSTGLGGVILGVLPGALWVPPPGTPYRGSEGVKKPVFGVKNPLFGGFLGQWPKVQGGPTKCAILSRFRGFLAVAWGLG